MEVQHVFYGLDGRNPQEDPQVKELVKTQRINETCKENCNFLTQEPVSNDLEGRFEFNPNRSFEERCEIVRRTAITEKMTYEERLADQLRRYGL